MITRILLSNFLNNITECLYELVSSTKNVVFVLLFIWKEDAMRYNISLAEYYNIPIELFNKYGILNPCLKENTKMFIDPVLLKDSQYEIFSKEAYRKYLDFFENLYEQMRIYVSLPEDLKIKSKNTMIRKFQAKGIPYLCLGFSVSGNLDKGIGINGASRILNNAERLFGLDIDNNPAIFSVVYLLTEKVGPDYISDMTAQIIIEQIKQFTQEMSPKLGLEVFKFGKHMLPRHPFMDCPILLLPEDILNLLPIDVDINDVYKGYSPNDDVRDKVNEYIGSIFKSSNDKKRKSSVQKQLFDYFNNNIDVLNDFMQYAKKRKSYSYDFDVDKCGYYFEQRFSKAFDLNDIDVSNLNQLEIIDKTIMGFKDKIDNNNDIKRNLLWVNNKPRGEKSWQQAFHLAIFQKLEDSGFDISPEYQTGSGPIDFTISKGCKHRFLIEIKLSSNNPLKGLEIQLEKYKQCIGNKKAYFICFNLEKDDQKYHKIIHDLFQKKEDLNLNTDIVIIDGRINPSASNIKRH